MQLRALWKQLLELRSGCCGRIARIENLSCHKVAQVQSQLKKHELHGAHLNRKSRPSFFKYFPIIGSRKIFQTESGDVNLELTDETK